VCWAIHHGRWPEDEITHADSDGSNYRISNLVHGTILERPLDPRNKSGVKGVTYDPQRQKWYAKIRFNGVQHALGRFDGIEDAIVARKEGEERIWNK
jgi:hypothetical protein